MNNEPLWGVFHETDGLLMADPSERECRRVALQWGKTLPGQQYTARVLTEAEVAEVMAWPKEEA